MTSNPFMTFIMRCCERPVMMSKAIDSALAQTDRDFEIIFIPDFKRRGVKWANKQFALHSHRVNSTYIYTLDDDSIIVYPKLISRLKRITRAKEPGIVMVKVRRPQIAPHILPKPYVWGQRDKLRVTTTNGGCFVVRADVWKKYSHAYGIPGSGDWNFLGTVKSKPDITFHWEDVIAKEAQQLGRGRKFEKCGQDWFSNVAKTYGFTEVGPNDWRLLPKARRRVVQVEKPKKRTIVLATQKAKKKKKPVIIRVVNVPRRVIKRIKKNVKRGHSLPNRRQ